LTVIKGHYEHSFIWYKYNIPAAKSRKTCFFSSWRVEYDVSVSYAADGNAAAHKAEALANAVVVAVHVSNVREAIPVLNHPNRPPVAVVPDAVEMADGAAVATIAVAANNANRPDRLKKFILHSSIFLIERLH
jgi:hypothetical protein